MAETDSELQLSGERVGVTGAGGFIGGAVCRRLVAEGAEVVGIELDAVAAERAHEAGAEPAIADVADRAALDRALAGARAVVHTAAIVSDWGAMEDFIRVNVRGTVNVIDAAAAAGAERVLHTSSVVVYGYDDPSEQGDDAHRRTYGIPYIDTKSASDRIACRRGCVVIRPGDVYGPRSVPWALRPLEVVTAGQAAVPGDGVMLPAYIDDLAEAMVLGLRRGRSGGAYAVWDGNPVPFAELFERYALMAGARGPRWLPRPLMSAIGMAMEAAARARRRPPPFTRHAVTLIDRRGTVSNRSAREELGWEPRVDFDEGMRRTEEWFRAEGLL